MRNLRKYPDKDRLEVDSMVEAFKGMTPEQIKENFEDSH